MPFKLHTPSGKGFLSFHRGCVDFRWKSLMTSLPRDWEINHNRTTPVLCQIKSFQFLYNTENTNKKVVTRTCCMYVYILYHRSHVGIQRTKTETCKRGIGHCKYAVHYFYISHDASWLKVNIKCSSVASPICQEGQSEITFSLFAFSSQFFVFFPDFSSFFPDFPLFPLIFWNFFAVRGGTLPPFDPPVPMPLIKWYFN